jgi:hypothetical protein
MLWLKFPFTPTRKNSSETNFHDTAGFHAMETCLFIFGDSSFSQIILLLSTPSVLFLLNNKASGKNHATFTPL